MDLVVLGFEHFVGIVADAAAIALVAMDGQKDGRWSAAAKAVETIKTTPSPDHPFRQFIISWFVLTFGAYVFYFFFSGLNYYLIHHRYGNLGHMPYKGQVRAEIMMACKAIPVMGLLTAPIVVLECQGYARLYGPGTQVGYADYGHTYTIVTVAIFLLFTDACIYWIHRLLHYGWIYQTLHKDHHKWKHPTPFASHAFHPVDGWVQSVPYHLFAFFVPMHKVVFLSLFVFVNIWTVSIHDGASFIPPRWLNGAAHHTYHHKDFLYNYGQYFVFWDWFGDTLRSPYDPGRLLNKDGVSKSTSTNDAQPKAASKQIEHWSSDDSGGGVARKRPQSKK
jgi:Delta7-sterol 5-desaturase